MMILLSPAKTLDFDSPIPSFATSTQAPPFLEQSQELIRTLQTYDEAALSDLMGLSTKLSQLNLSRYQAWTGQGERAAIYTFKGDVYQGFDASTLTAEQLQVAERSLKILSGLYGSLSPLTLIEAHRLEMGTKLKTKRATNLYQFWKEQVTGQMTAQLEESKAHLIIDLASQEYSKVIDWAALKKRGIEVMTPVFKDEKQGTYKVISFYAKRARGLFARHLINLLSQESLSEIELSAEKKQRVLESFTSEGYQYDPSGSTPKAPLFIRSEANRLR